jgi:hypothetical protein
MSDEPYIAGRLVERLSPPAEREDASYRLFLVRDRLEQEEWAVATFGGQKTADARAQILKLREKVARLHPRAAQQVGKYLDYTLAEQVPHFRRVFLSELSTEFAPGSVSTDVNWEMLLKILMRALKHAADELEPATRGRKATLGPPAKDALNGLVELYCRCHHAKWPTYDDISEAVRRPDSVIFALDCLRAWEVSAAKDVTVISAARMLTRPDGFKH